MIADFDSIAFLMAVYPKLGWTVAAVAAVVLPAIALLWWLDPFRVRLRAALFGAVACFAALCALVARHPERSLRGVRSQQFRVEVRTHRLHQRVRPLHPRLSRIRRCRDRAVGRGAGQLHDGEAAAAYRHDFRRGQFRHHPRARRQGLAGIPGSLPLVRRQVAGAAGRRRRRTELVHRIQRADRAVGEELRALRRFRDPHRRRPGRARPAAHAWRAAATRPSASIRCGAGSAARGSSRPRRASSTFSMRGTSARRLSSRTASISTRP